MNRPTDVLLGTTVGDGDAAFAGGLNGERAAGRSVRAAGPSALAVRQQSSYQYSRLLVGAPREGTMIMQRFTRALAALLPYRISVTRSTRRAGSSIEPCRRVRSVGLALVGALALSVAGVTPALADTSGGETATVNIAVRSITVASGNQDTTKTTFDTCFMVFDSTGSTLTFPDGTCHTTGNNNVTVTNGQAPGHIDVQGADAIPSDNGTHWTLCQNGSGIACTGAAGPGLDQFAEQDSSGTGASPLLTTSPQADTGFSSGGAATANQATTERIDLDGPSSSTDNSSSFTTAWTWTAVP